MAHRWQWKKLPPWHWIVAGVFAVLAVLTLVTWALDGWETVTQAIVSKTQENELLGSKIASISAELQRLKNDDQYKRNERLSGEIKDIEAAYKGTVAAYEELLKLKELAKDTKRFDMVFADALTLLSNRNYASASSAIKKLTSDLQAEREKIASSFMIPANVKKSNSAPAAGYSRQSVKTDTGTYLVDMVAADMSGTRVVVDTASDGTCPRDCPVKSLFEYVSRTGAFAGINGSYFCPAEYPSCSEKKNSFDTLLMNKNKVYFNSDNNVYSTVPAVIFLNGSMRFVGRSLEWSRDTGVDGVIANQPLLLSGGNIAFGGGSDLKQGSKGNRSFVGNKGSTAYIGVVHNATVAEVAIVLKALGLDNALNLDSGGSTALWSGGYKVGPGRNIPNVILFVRK